uniref:Putative secreted protein n=1 Tax=Anopheles darlingi TaxID=43151 RepID=A0A2M4DJM3_ANODA
MVTVKLRRLLTATMVAVRIAAVRSVRNVNLPYAGVANKGKKNKTNASAKCLAHNRNRYHRHVLTRHTTIGGHTCSPNSTYGGSVS